MHSNFRLKKSEFLFKIFEIFEKLKDCLNQPKTQISLLVVNMLLSPIILSLAKLGYSQIKIYFTHSSLELECIY